MSRELQKSSRRWALIGTAMIAFGLLVNAPVGVWMLIDGLAGRAALQLAVGVGLVLSGLKLRSRP